jgi:hypothetical protein
VHAFDSTCAAYEASQVRDDIRDGDVLVVESERVVGILVEAWPVAVTRQSGQFHALAPDAEWTAMPVAGDAARRDYSPSLRAANLACAGLPAQ